MATDFELPPWAAVKGVGYCRRLQLRILDETLVRLYENQSANQDGQPGTNLDPDPTLQAGYPPAAFSWSKLQQGMNYKRKVGQSLDIFVDFCRLRNLGDLKIPFEEIRGGSEEKPRNLWVDKGGR